MSNLMQVVANEFGGKICNDAVKFSKGDDSFCLTDGTLYAASDDGSFLPGFKKVRSIAAVRKFVELRIA